LHIYLFNLLAEIHKLRGARGALFIQLANFPNYYLVLVIRDRGFNYALISTKILPESSSATMVMEDIAFLDFDSLHGENIVITAHSAEFDPHINMQRSRVSVDGNSRGDEVGQTSGSVQML
jgi:mediator of RNA polymerase II transcription subunit 14